MNEIVHKFLLTGDREIKLLLLMHVDAPHADSNDLAKRTASDKILKGRAYEIALNPQYDGHQKGLAKMVYNFFDKKAR